MGAELEKFFYDQEVTGERMGRYASALRFHANKASGYASDHPEVAGMIGMGFPFYLPKQVPDDLRVPEVDRFVAAAKDTLSDTELQNWGCPSCFSESNLSGTRNLTCKSCGIESFKPTDLQKIYMDLDMLCLIDGDEKTFHETATALSHEIRTGFSPSLDFDIAASLDQYSSFVADPLSTPPPMDLHFARTDDFLRTVASIQEGRQTDLPVVSAYEKIKESSMPFGLGSLFLSEPILANGAMREALNAKRQEFVQSPADAKTVLDGIKARSGQVKRMFAPQDLENMLLEKMNTPYTLPEKGILVFGTSVDGQNTSDSHDLSRSEGLWRVQTAVALAGKTHSPILFSGFESEDMAKIAVDSNPALAPYIFIEPYSSSTEENIRAASFFEGKLVASPDDWVGVSNKWHLERVRWLVSSLLPGVHMQTYPIEQAMADDGVNEIDIDRFQYQRYAQEAAKIRQVAGYIPPFR